MRATDELKDEHRVIERVLSFYQAVAKAAQDSRDLPVESLREAIEFTRSFADRYHHGKEEGVLFERLGEAGMPREGGPVGVMRVEHDQGRAHIASLADAVDRYGRGDKSAAAEIAQAAQDYADLLAQHIYKEDNILYVMADQLLSEDDEQIVEAYRRAEDASLTDEERQRLLEVAQRLANEAKTL